MRLRWIPMDTGTLMDELNSFPPPLTDMCRVEIIVQKPVETTENVTTTDVSTYRMVSMLAH